MVFLVGGEIAVLFVTVPAGIGHIRNGRLIALGISTLKRDSTLPDVPAIAEAIGMPDFEASEWHEVVVPAGTPKAVINRLHREIVKVLAMPEVKERVANVGSTVVGSTPKVRLAMIGNVLDAIEAAAPAFANINLLQGTKYYGSYLGPFKTPAKESDPRVPGGDFFYAEEDLVGNQAFNVSNGDLFRWKHLWPALAGFFWGLSRPGRSRTRSRSSWPTSSRCGIR
ncbi:MAG: hypothetical protein HY525_00045 [Betaproteobacteria bacterium]|nr:hypothetical protein [Betaproteobacteria bacterium]